MAGNKVTSREKQLTSFVKFLQTGELGPLNFDLSVNEVYNLLGTPERTERPGEGTERDHFLNLSYKNLVLSFFHDQLVVYIIQYRNVRKVATGGLPPQLQVPWFYTVRKMTFTDFVDLVKSHHIRAQRLVGQVNERGESILFQNDGGELIRFPNSGVEVFFDLNISNTIYQINCGNVEPHNIVCVDVE